MSRIERNRAMYDEDIDHTDNLTENESYIDAYLDPENAVSEESGEASGRAGRRHGRVERRYGTASEIAADKHGAVDSRHSAATDIRSAANTHTEPSQSIAANTAAADKKVAPVELSKYSGVQQSADKSSAPADLSKADKVAQAADKKTAPVDASKDEKVEPAAEKMTAAAAPSRAGKAEHVAEKKTAAATPSRNGKAKKAAKKRAPAKPVSRNSKALQADEDDAPAALTGQGRILKYVGTAILALALVMCTVLVLPKFLGIKTFLVASGSMSPTISVGSMIYTKEVNPVNLVEGDVIVFYKTGQTDEDAVPITHRVMSNDPDAKTIITKGDANTSSDPMPIQYNNVVGKVVWHVPVLGLLAAPLTKPVGKLIVVLIVFEGFLFAEVGSRTHKKNREARKSAAQ